MTYVLAARILGPSDYGVLAGAIGIAIVTYATADFGINGWLIRALAQGREGSLLFAETLSAKVVLAVVLACGWAAVSLLLLPNGRSKPAIAALSLYVLFAVLSGTVTVPFRASERMVIAGVLSGVEKVVCFGAWVIFQWRGNVPLAALPVALAIGSAAAAVCGGLMLPRGMLSFKTPSAATFVALWRSSFSFGMVGASTQLLRSDVAIVGAASGTLAAGLYAAPARITSFLTVIPTAFSGALFPRVARGKREGRQTELLAALIMMSLLGTVYLGLWIMAPIVVRIALGIAYSASVPVFRIVLLVAFVNSANQPLVAYLQASGHERYVARTVVLSVLIGLVAIAAGAIYGGPVGAAFGSLAMQSGQFAMLVRKVTANNRSVKSIGEHGATSSAVEAQP